MSDHAASMYGFCEAFFAELRAAGVEHAVVSPGARSMPLVIGADRAGLRLWVQIDERSAGFFALGMSKGLRSPTALVCTSGTAAANYLPAVLEADRSGVPLIVLTADRPPELRRWGSNQTIEQMGLYGRATRWTAETPVASESTRAVARRYAARAAAVSAASPAGPVHLNFPFRAPLAPRGFAEARRATDDEAIAVWAGQAVAPATAERFRSVLSDHTRGVILAGAVNPGDLGVQEVFAVGAAAGWPILAEPTSQLRVAAPDTDATVVSTASYLVQHVGFAEEAAPEAVVLVGAVPPQRSLRRWLAALRGARVVVVGDGSEWQDESFTHTDVLRCDPGALFREVARGDIGREPSQSWIAAWRDADEAAAGALGNALIGAGMFEGRMVTALAGALPDEAALYVGNSMSVRDVNLYWPRRDRPIDIYSNRGVSGIDGMISSALGVAAVSAGPVVLLLGDLSLLHDLSGLLAAVRLDIPIVVVVSNNDGGGIFSFLPIADHGDSVHFHELFHTPHGTDLGSVVSGLGVDHRLVASSTDLQGALVDALAVGRPTVIEVAVDPAASVAAHRAVDAAVREAVSALW